MSRGPGTVMSAVLRELAAAVDEGYRGVLAPSMPYFIHGDDPTPAQRESVRRAVRTLIAHGAVTSSGTTVVTGLDGKHYPAAPGHRLLTLSATGGRADGPPAFPGVQDLDT